MNELAHLAEIADKAVSIGHNLLTGATPTDLRYKSDRDTVTDLDTRIERETRDYLARETPDIGFLGEEEGQHGSTEEMWVLDPIDGTSNFVHGIPLYAVSLALVRNDQPVVGVINAPALGMHYTATDGGGAYCNGKPIHATNTTNLAHAIISIGDYATGPDAAEKNEQRLAITARLAERVERVRMFGSAALDLAWVAEGRTDGCIILGGKTWDLAAGSLLTRSAGAVFDTLTGTCGNSQGSVSAGAQLAHVLISVTEKGDA